jgi:hypothetical protein
MGEGQEILHSGQKSKIGPLNEPLPESPTKARFQHVSQILKIGSNQRLFDDSRTLSFNLKHGATVHFFATRMILSTMEVGYSLTDRRPAR